MTANQRLSISERIAIEENKRCLTDLIEIYKEIYYSRGEKLKKLIEQTGINKEELLPEIEKDYAFRLDALKKTGVDISEYPKSLGELTK